MSTDPAPDLFDGPESGRRRLMRGLVLLQVVCLLMGLPALVVQWGFEAPPAWLGHVFVPLALLLTAIPLARWRLSLSPRQFLRENALETTHIVISLAGAAIVGLLALLQRTPLAAALRIWCEWAVLIWVGLGTLQLFHRVGVTGWKPATVVVLSFAGVILAGTLLLMLPVTQATGQGGDFWTALFTTTSAVCVTGLNVVDPGTHWTRGGQSIILGLIQVGGLGLMTFGAFFALAVGRGLLGKETVLLGQILEKTGRRDVKRLLTAILIFTFSIEAVGAAGLWTLWPEKPPAERLYFAVFHSVSAFCNAGFGLLPNNLENYNARWQAWGVVAGLIILGGLGFAVMRNALHVLRGRRISRRAAMPFEVPGRPERLNLTSRLALVTTLVLLVGGTAVVWLLEYRRSFARLPWNEQLAAAWFQSVTCRTAGFNTVPIGELSDATKFFMVFLMIVGASPGSTGGGVKTVVFAIVLLSLRAVLRHREQVKVAGRQVPPDQVGRALLILALAILLLTVMTVVVVACEDRPGKFIDYLFEVASALGTVGLSAGVTPELTLASRIVLIVAMFLGRIGPLTLLVAMAAQEVRGRVKYPPERVALG